ncbi:hypothetical protein Hanom_Chr12g01169741 [Helianthus anomalus]
MRSMPVRAGRRKKKAPPPTHCRYVISQEAFESEAVVANHIEFAPDSEGISPKVLSSGQNSPCFGANVSGKESRDDCSSSSGVENKVGKKADTVVLPVQEELRTYTTTPGSISIPILISIGFRALHGRITHGTHPHPPQFRRQFLCRFYPCTLPDTLKFQCNLHLTGAQFLGYHPPIPS